MASIEEAIYAWWTGNGTLCSLAGSRLYPDRLPQGVTYPAATYRMVSENQPLAHDGALDLVSTSMQFDVYANAAKAAKALARTLRQQLHGYTGTMGTVAVHGVFHLSSVEDFGEALGIYRVSVDFRFTYKEA